MWCLEIAWDGWCYLRFKNKTVVHILIITANRICARHSSTLLQTTFAEICSRFASCYKYGLSAMSLWIVGLASESAYLLQWRHWALNGNWVKPPDHRRNEALRSKSRCLRFRCVERKAKPVCWFNSETIAGDFMLFLRW